MYSRPPLETVDGIPVFHHAGSDEYDLCYQAIADEHLEAFHRDGTNPFMAREHIQALVNATVPHLTAHVPAGGSILDAGVGIGEHLKHLDLYDRHGIDLSIGYLKVARDRGITAALAQIEEPPYSRNTFDAILCTDVLEHVLDLNWCVTALLALLKPGGVMVVRVPRREHLEPYIGYKYRFVHLRILDETMLTLMFDRVFGCEVLTAEAVVDGAESICVVRKP